MAMTCLHVQINLGVAWQLPLALLRQTIWTAPIKTALMVEVADGIHTQKIALLLTNLPANQIPVSDVLRVILIVQKYITIVLNGTQTKLNVIITQAMDVVMIVEVEIVMDEIINLVLVELVAQNNLNEVVRVIVFSHRAQDQRRTRFARVHITMDDVMDEHKGLAVVLRRVETSSKVDAITHTIQGVAGRIRSISISQIQLHSSRPIEAQNEE